MSIAELVIGLTLLVAVIGGIAALLLMFFSHG